MITSQESLKNIIKKYDLVLYDDYYTQENGIYELNCKISRNETLNHKDFEILNNRVTHIGLYNKDTQVSKVVKVPLKKFVGLEWVETKWKSATKTQESYYGVFKEFLEKHKIKGIDATSFGFSKLVLLESKKLNDYLDKFTNLLKSHNIEFKIRNSQAGWCINWVVSKKQENIAKFSTPIEL